MSSRPDSSTVPQTRGWLRVLHHTEHGALAALLLLMALIPVVELIGRRFFGFGIRGATDYLRHLTLWVGFLGAVLATRQARHIQIGLALHVLPPGIRPWIRGLTAFASIAVCAGLLGASLQLMVAEAPGLPRDAARFIPDALERWLEPFGLFDPGGFSRMGGWLPVWVAQLVMPFGFAAMMIRFALDASERRSVQALTALAFPLAALLPLFVPNAAHAMMWPGIGLLVIAALLGSPIFILLGGTALLLFWGTGETPVAAIPAKTYEIVSSEHFPAIPLFTLTGFVLSAGHASERLVRLFRAFFGWIPGGLAVATTLLCAFFTTFTGASGVTILALGGLLLPVLLKGGFKEGFSVGLLTSTGSIGLLLPPSLVVILYGVVAQVSIVDVFKAGLLPGNLLILPVVLWCVWKGKRMQVERVAFDAREALKALWVAKWEISMPVLVLVLIFQGICTFVEASAVLVAYAIFVECMVYRDIGCRALMDLLVRCAGLVGGVLIILGVAMGLTSYLVDAQVPMHAADWVAANVHSRWLFLLALNGALILVGCLMDIYSALVVVVPLILPMAAHFGVDPVHLGIIFLANLQLGYITPPVGMNLFLASFRFERPLLKVSRDAFPFLLLMAAVVLLITYLPWLSIGVMELLR